MCSDFLDQFTNCFGCCLSSLFRFRFIYLVFHWMCPASFISYFQCVVPFTLSCCFLDLLLHFCKLGRYYFIYGYFRNAIFLIYQSFSLFSDSLFLLVFSILKYQQTIDVNGVLIANRFVMIILLLLYLLVH